MPLPGPLADAYQAYAVDGDAAGELLADAEVERLLAPRPGWRQFAVEDGITVEATGRHPENIEAALDQSVALALALFRVSELAWTRVAQRCGLAVDKVDGTRRLGGSVQGRRIEIRESGPPFGLQVTAEVRPALPEGTEVIAPAGRGVSESLQDPVLDGHLTVRTSDIAALRSRLVRDDVRGALLEVLNFHADSVLTAHELRVVATGRSERRLTAVIDAVLALLTALDDDQPPT